MAETYQLDRCRAQQRDLVVSTGHTVFIPLQPNHSVSPGACLLRTQAPNTPPAELPRLSLESLGLAPLCPSQLDHSWDSMCSVWNNKVNWTGLKSPAKGVSDCRPHERKETGDLTATTGGGGPNSSKEFQSWPASPRCLEPLFFPPKGRNTKQHPLSAKSEEGIKGRCGRLQDVLSLNLFLGKSFEKS